MKLYLCLLLVIATLLLCCHSKQTVEPEELFIAEGRVRKDWRPRVNTLVALYCYAKQGFGYDTTNTYTNENGFYRITKSSQFFGRRYTLECLGEVHYGIIQSGVFVENFDF